MTIGELAALGIRLRFRSAGDLEWMHEGLSETARRAVGVAILRRSVRRAKGLAPTRRDNHHGI